VANKNHQVAVVTGAGRGIGASIAEHLAKQGYALVLVSRTESELNEIQKRINKNSAVTLETLALDISQKEAILKIEQAVQKLGDWQVLINNAGVCYQDEIKKMSDESFEKMLAINVTTVFRLCRSALNKMSQDGVIINHFG
jgi:short-subunit dehydrogenase